MRFDSTEKSSEVFYITTICYILCSLMQSTNVSCKVGGVMACGRAACRSTLENTKTTTGMTVIRADGLSLAVLAGISELHLTSAPKAKAEMTL